MNTITKSRTETEKLFADLDKPSLVGLSYALRHPELWPKNFTWEYKHCTTCAMGLAHQLWGAIPEGSNDHNKGASIMAKAFGIPFAAAQNIFMGRIGGATSNWMPVKRETKTSGALWWEKKTTVQACDFSCVTPEMIADQIDKYLETAE